MTGSERLSTFGAAIFAFQVRLERELVSCWEDLELETRLAAMDAVPAAKRTLLQSFFHDVEEAIAGVIHKYFPRLLQVATAHPHRLGDQSPLRWTQAQVLMEVCTFVRMEEQFNHNSAPREDSLVLETAERITMGDGWREDRSASEFRLPRWVEIPHPADLLRNPYSSEKMLGEPDAEPLSRADTLQWVKAKEFWIRQKLDRQLDDESWDGIIEAGKGVVSVLTPSPDVEVETGRTQQTVTALNEMPPENRFIREPATWEITFGGEACRVSHTIGFEYISVLLQNPGKPMRALELQHLAGGMSKVTPISSEHGVGSLDQIPDHDRHLLGQSDFSRADLVDDRARREIEGSLLELERDIAYSREIGDTLKIRALEDEHATLAAYLSRSRSINRRARAFSGENEKARTSITKALKRAYDKIRAQAPTTANHLESGISAGSEFVYRDSSVGWQIRRSS